MLERLGGVEWGGTATTVMCVSCYVPGVGGDGGYSVKFCIEGAANDFETMLLIREANFQNVTLDYDAKLLLIREVVEIQDYFIL